MTDNIYIVAVHGGAGFHNKLSDAKVKNALKLACRGALAGLEKGESSLQAVECAIRSMEDEESLNAGQITMLLKSHL